MHDALACNPVARKKPIDRNPPVAYAVSFVCDAGRSLIEPKAASPRTSTLWPKSSGAIVCDASSTMTQESQMPSIHRPLLERITIDPDVRFGKPSFAAAGSPFRSCWNGFPVGHLKNRFWPTTPSSSRMISWPYTRMPLNWRRSPKFPEDQAPLRLEPITSVGSVVTRSVPAIRKRSPKRARLYR